MCVSYLFTIHHFLDTGRMPDHTHLTLFPFRQTLLSVGTFLGHILIIVLHDDPKNNIATFVDAINDILVEVLILRRNVCHRGHLYPEILVSLVLALLPSKRANCLFYYPRSRGAPSGAEPKRRRRRR